jgi:CHAD domain-containing protein
MMHVLRRPDPSTISPLESHFGIGHWMECVLQECEKAGRGFAPEPVHDLWVALRRCRSLADGMRFIDPDPSWKRMRRAGKPLFSALGELRDAQVLAQWVQRLVPEDDPAANALIAHASREEVRLRDTASFALYKFDRKQWRTWIDDLSTRANRLQPGGLVFRHLALECWEEARQLHRLALRNRTKVSYHRLRIGLKRFRYTVENFLPGFHERCGHDLKKLQDYLGEIHDLDLLWATALKLESFRDQRTMDYWRPLIERERKKRVDEYRERMLGETSLWNVWRAELPAQPNLGALARMETWAKALDPQPEHARHVAALAIELYDGLCASGFLSPLFRNGRETLRTAALMHEIGRSKTSKKYHKASSGLIRKLKAPLGWSADDLATTALLVRHHRGRFPLGVPALRCLSPEQRDFVIACAGILRLADAMDCGREEKVHKLTVHNRGTYLEIAAWGYQSAGRLAEKIARARYPLETFLDRPVLVRAAQ